MNPNLFTGFVNVTLAPVLYGGTPRHEMRLYLPKRIELKTAVTLSMRAAAIYDETKCPVGVTRVVTLEYNRAGVCFCTVVAPTPELVTAVNAFRKARRLKPIAV